jgi:glyoxylase-like metal-dependent hydrolase (beta-lactamase superfamily II)
MTGPGNWTYFFPGPAPVLIDAGVGQPAHLEAMAAVAPDGPAHVLVSHAHSDHIGGVAAILARWPQTRFSKWPWPERDRNFPADWHPLADGELVAAGDAELEVIHTPGHAPDHVVFWDAAARTVYAGDLVVPGTTVVIPASLGGSLSAYLRSLDRVLALRPLRLMPAHGEPVDDPEEIIRRYIAHRRERERQVVGALQSGMRTVDELVAHIYVGLNAALIPMARESVLAHLRKLAEEGFAGPDGEGWTIY